MKKPTRKAARVAHPDFPTRAADVFRESVAKIEHGGVSVVIEPFTIRRVALLHTVQSPLFYTCPRFGNGIGWMLSVYIMAYDQDDASLQLAELGLSGFVQTALAWADGLKDYELCAMCALAIQDGWDRILSLDPPDIMPKDGSPPSGNA